MVVHHDRRPVHHLTVEFATITMVCTYSIEMGTNGHQSTGEQRGGRRGAGTDDPSSAHKCFQCNIASHHHDRLQRRYSPAHGLLVGQSLGTGAYDDAGLGVRNGQRLRCQRRCRRSAQQRERRPVQGGHGSAPNGIHQEIAPLNHRLFATGIARLHHHRLHPCHTVEHGRHHQQVAASHRHCGTFHHWVAGREHFAQCRHGIGKRHQLHDGGGVEMG